MSTPVTHSTPRFRGRHTRTWNAGPPASSSPADVAASLMHELRGEIACPTSDCSGPSASGVTSCTRRTAGPSASVSALLASSIAAVVAGDASSRSKDFVLPAGLVSSMFMMLLAPRVMDIFTDCMRKVSD